MAIWIKLLKALKIVIPSPVYKNRANDQFILAIYFFTV